MVELFAKIWQIPKDRPNINENLFLIIENDSKTIPNIESQPFDVVNNDIFVPFYYYC